MFFESNRISKEHLSCSGNKSVAIIQNQEDVEVESVSCGKDMWELQASAGTLDSNITDGIIQFLTIQIIRNS